MISYSEYSDAISIPSAPNSLNSRRPSLSSIKPTEQVPGSTIPPSSVHLERDVKRIQPQPSITQFANKPQPPSPPLPPPPPPEMGITTSQFVGPDVSAPTFKDFQPPRVLATTNGSPATYNYQNQRQLQQRPNQPNGRPVSPPLPPGAAQPANFQHLQSRQPDVASARHQPPNLYQHLQPQPQSYKPQPQPPISQPQPPAHPQQAPAPVSLRKSSSLQAATAPMRGKPRIFAAMEAQENEVDPAPDVLPGPPQPQPHQQHQPQIRSQTIPQYNPAQNQPQYQPQSQPQPPQPHHVISHRPLPPINHNQQHPQQASLLPPVEFATPKSRPDPLPNNVSSKETDWFSSQPMPPPSIPKAAIPDQAPFQQPDLALRTPRSNLPRPLPQDEPRQQLHSPQATPRARKLSKPRNNLDNSSMSSHPNGSSATLQSSPETTHRLHQNGSHRSTSRPIPSTPMSPSRPLPAQPEPPAQVDEDTIRNAGIPLDDDPFARVEGVTMLKPATPPPSKEGSIKRLRDKGSLKGPSASSDSVIEDGAGRDDTTNGSVESVAQLAKPLKEHGTTTPLTPVSPEDYRHSRKERKRGKSVNPPPTTVVDAIAAVDNRPPPEPFTLVKFLSDPHFLSTILTFFTFYDWCVLSAISKEIRVLLVRTPALKEVVLESHLRTIGYSRWIWDDQEPLTLSLQDLNDYMRGVSTPTHEYARVAGMYVHSLTIHPNHRDPSLSETVRALTASTRAYTRVLLRLRAQAEKEASLQSLNLPQPPPSAASMKSGNFSPARGGTASRVSSRAPSPTISNNSHSHYGPTHTPGAIQQTSSQTSLTFRSPLFRLRRAPLLRVFVPSPEGDWLSDKSVLECEAECKRAGVVHLMRLGDVVWDVAVGDEGNVGRLVWDGSYLIDLDYTYSPIGDLPKYLPTLAFPPSYFHRVIRTGPNVSNPVVHVDISPWGEEIAMNLQLLQDRVRTETPQGAYHNVVRWVHRSSFSVRPSRGPQRYNNGGRGPPFNGRIPIPDSSNLFVDGGWYGTIVVETEGTNEALADLQDRCGPGAFPPRPRGVNGQVSQAQVENRKVFRILREKSRPGEIWIKAVSVKERLL
ncbi:hypothetical protein GALMADRAFT_1241203 [Galerina marginata CBS 339.88]|uniref:Uncharacterized protein n=1 Tax=Galerina marginata (strain CBS 339.88) TaxID=685588 RepID=A0A067T8G9_GALM3|nr:hypothetical protein GALMADRAFT_1241203 [Galerina marginata CBS 339.88]